MDLLEICFFVFLSLFEGTVATYTRVGNTYMKKPDTCCSLDISGPRTDCAMTNLYATNRIQLSFSPSFPSRFPIGRVCMWSVQCKSGHQVRLEFRDFYLIGPDATGHCVDQYVKITSPITGHSMGRFCGNSGIPTIVSAGNLVVVQLQSEIPQSSENYRGFAFVFRETLEAPNPEMRPSDWINHGQYSIDTREIARRLKTMKPTDASQIPTSQPPTKSTTTARTTTFIDQMKPTSSTRKTILTPTERMTIKPVETPNNAKRTTTYVPPFASVPGRYPGWKRKKPNLYGNNNNKDVNIITKSLTPDIPLSIEVWVGIAAGGVCALLLCILIGCKIFQIRRRSQRRIEERQQAQRANQEQPVQMVDLTIRNPLAEKTNKTNQLPGSYPNGEPDGNAAQSSNPPGYYLCQDLAQSPPSYGYALQLEANSHGQPAASQMTLPMGGLNQVQYPPPHGCYMPYPYSSQGAPFLAYDPNTGAYYPQSPPLRQQPPMTSPTQLPCPAIYGEANSSHIAPAVGKHFPNSSSLSSDEDCRARREKARDVNLRDEVPVKKRRKRRKRRRR